MVAIHSPLSVVYYYGGGYNWSVVELLEGSGGIITECLLLRAVNSVLWVFIWASTEFELLRVTNCILGVVHHVLCEKALEGAVDKFFGTRKL